MEISGITKTQVQILVFLCFLLFFRPPWTKSMPWRLNVELWQTSLYKKLTFPNLSGAIEDCFFLRFWHYSSYRMCLAKFLWSKKEMREKKTLTIWAPLSFPIMVRHLSKTWIIPFQLEGGRAAAPPHRYKRGQKFTAVNSEMMVFTTFLGYSQESLSVCEIAVGA